MIVVGGLGSILGSVLGAAVITTLNDSLAGFQSYRPFIFGAILIASMLFMPGGIASALQKLPGREGEPS
jgi:branched-chain amino acid transport system permease protein